MKTKHWALYMAFTVLLVVGVVFAAPMLRTHTVTAVQGIHVVYNYADDSISVGPKEIVVRCLVPDPADADHPFVKMHKITFDPNTAAIPAGATTIGGAWAAALRAEIDEQLGH